VHQTEDSMAGLDRSLKMMDGRPRWSELSHAAVQVEHA